MNMLHTDQQQNLIFFVCRFPYFSTDGGRASRTGDQTGGVQRTVHAVKNSHKHIHTVVVSFPGRLVSGQNLETLIMNDSIIMCFPIELYYMYSWHSNYWGYVSFDLYISLHGPNGDKICGSATDSSKGSGTLVVLGHQDHWLDSAHCFLVYCLWSGLGDA